MKQVNGMNRAGAAALCTGLLQWLNMASSDRTQLHESIEAIAIARALLGAARSIRFTCIN